MSIQTFVSCSPEGNTFTVASISVYSSACLSACLPLCLRTPLWLGCAFMFPAASATPWGCRRGRGRHHGRVGPRSVSLFVCNPMGFCMAPSVSVLVERAVFAVCAGTSPGIRVRSSPCLRFCEVRLCFSSCIVRPSARCRERVGQRMWA